MTTQVTDRRIHRVFVTRNTEYHLRRDRCVAVRDLSTGCWRDTHRALFQRVTGAVRLLGNGSLTAKEGLPTAGESLLFEGREGALTSPVVAVERPSFGLVLGYPGPQVAGG